MNYILYMRTHWTSAAHIKLQCMYVGRKSDSRKSNTLTKKINNSIVKILELRTKTHQDTPEQNKNLQNKNPTAHNARKNRVSLIFLNYIGCYNKNKNLITNIGYYTVESWKKYSRLRINSYNHLKYVEFTRRQTSYRAYHRSYYEVSRTSQLHRWSKPCSSDALLMNTR